MRGTKILQVLITPNTLPPTIPNYKFIGKEDIQYAEKHYEQCEYVPSEVDLDNPNVTRKDNWIYIDELETLGDDRELYIPSPTSEPSNHLPDTIPECKEEGFKEEDANIIEIIPFKSKEIVSSIGLDIEKKISNILIDISLLTKTMMGLNNQVLILQREFETYNKPVIVKL